MYGMHLSEGRFVKKLQKANAGGGVAWDNGIFAVWNFNEARGSIPNARQHMENALI